MEEGTTIPKGVKLAIAGVAALIALAVVISMAPFTIVRAGERGVVLKLGRVDRVLEEGLHFRNSFTEDVEKLDITTQIVQADAAAASKDLQTVTTKVALNFNIMTSTEELSAMWRELKREYVVKVVNPSIQEAIKSATAKYTAEELITKREAVKNDMKVALRERLVTQHINVSEVSITDFSFSKDFEKAIESKVTAEQEALVQKNKLEQFRYEADQKVATAKGEADSRVLAAKADAEARVLQAQAEAGAIRAQALALQSSPQFLDFKKLEVALEYAKHWTGSVPNTIITGQGGSTPVVPFFKVAE
jgi:regulator of protease activity HflC (stomatin/prohibitin superfamily)